MLAVILGLTSAAAWGAADFTGGLASRRTGAYQAVLYGEAVGLPIILVVAFLMREPFPLPAIWIPAMLGGILAGGLAGFIPGALKAFTGAHEVVTTIMLNAMIRFNVKRLKK